MSEKQVTGLYAQFKTDPELERTGIELEYFIDSNKSVIIKIARAGGGNSKYQRVLDVRTKPYRRQIQTDTIQPETLESVMREVYADSVVLGWFTATKDEKGNETRVATVDDSNGNPMEFSRDNVVKLFRELPDLFADVQTSANKVSLFRMDELEAAAKN
jgi:hypothetical protein